MKNQIKQITREHLSQMDSETYTELRDAYYKITDGLYAMNELSDSLGKAERKALVELEQAMNSLSHLGAIL